MGKIIISDVTVDRISDYSIYEYIEEIFFREGKPMTICNVTPEEYELMEEEITDIGNLNERIGNEGCVYKKLRIMMIPVRSEKFKLLISNYNNNNQRGNYTLDVNGIIYNEDGYQAVNYPEAFKALMFPKFHVYTTETYEDVIEYYSAIEKWKATVNQKTKELIEAIGWKCETCETPGCPRKAGSCGRWSRTIFYKDLLEK